ncbi:hypothetical protein GDO81_026597 [Engystomops pustulosus]|uniref:Uncharacterized protein n=1 Tax=Engystomops pustulosus TaxID=76066 RepID=A0AAV6YQM2_ENGPU|nr:hypothetical protein GDO81_026597 [Engystomops pustulosus]
MLHSSSMSFIFLDSSSFSISSFWITSDSESDACLSCLEILLRTLFSSLSSCFFFSRSSNPLLMSVYRALTLLASPHALS